MRFGRFSGIFLSHFSAQNKNLALKHDKLLLCSFSLLFRILYNTTTTPLLWATECNLILLSTSSVVTRRPSKGRHARESLAGRREGETTWRRERQASRGREGRYATSSGHTRERRHGGNPATTWSGRHEWRAGRSSGSRRSWHAGEGWHAGHTGHREGEWWRAGCSGRWEGHATGAGHGTETGGDSAGLVLREHGVRVGLAFGSVR